MIHTYILLVGACLSLVSASVYPTQPIQATVWSADQPMLITWIEDWKNPVLSEMGLLDISLWRDTDTYLVQLASNVDPMTKTHQVTVPAAVLKQGSKYTLWLTTTKPIDTVIYSADFVIKPANTTTVTGMGVSTGTGTTGSGVALATQSGTAGTGSGFRTVPTTTGSASSLSFTSMTASSDGSLTASGVPPPSGTISGSGVPVQGQQRAANAGRRGVDVEKLKFRFVFVIWPVLMGITMAL